MFKDNSDNVLSALADATRDALMAVGEDAVGDIRKVTPVDTGRLRNSIAYAIELSSQLDSRFGGEDNAVLIGTNVEYGKYLELGTVKMPKGYPFIKPTIENYSSDYEATIKKILRGG